MNGILVISPGITFGLPEGTLEWLHNGRILDPNNPRVTIYEGGILIVNDVQTSDRGVYTVSVSNIARPRGVTASVVVTINCKHMQQHLQ